jgi:hypothetical protein
VQVNAAKRANRRPAPEDASSRRFPDFSGCLSHSEQAAMAPRSRRTRLTEACVE